MEHPRLESVAIVARGSSCIAYIQAAAEQWCPQGLAQEVWAVNGMGPVIYHDRMFMIDSCARHFEPNALEQPASHEARLLDWLKTHDKPVYTASPIVKYPCTVRYPLKFVVERCRVQYLNCSAAYALAYAIAIGVKRIQLHGCDFAGFYEATAPSGEKFLVRTERGRACMEYLIGLAHSIKGIQIEIAGDSGLLGTASSGFKSFYGYTPEELSDELQDSTCNIWTQDQVIDAHEKGIDPKSVTPAYGPRSTPSASPPRLVPTDEPQPLASKDSRSPAPTPARAG